MRSQILKPYLMRRLAGAGVACVLCLAWCAGCVGPEKQVVKSLYEGPTRPAAEVATVHNANNIFIRRVNGGPVQGDQPGDRIKQSYHLLPGEHRLEVEFHEVDKTPFGEVYAWRQSYNLFTLRHNFEAGKSYRLGAEFERREGTDIVIPVLLNEEGQQLARPDISLRPPVVPPNATGATITGTAIAQDVDPGGWNPRPVTATGRDVYLVADTPETRKWLVQLRRNNKWHDSYIRGSAPAAVRPSIRSTAGYGVGHFELHDVPPGDYVIFFLEAWNTVSVRPGQRLVEGVVVTPEGPEPPREPKQERV